MKIDLTPATRESLENQHRKERDKRGADRIKAVLLVDKGWTQAKIAEALLIDRDTVHQHVEDYLVQNKLKPANGGSEQKLNAEQAQALIAHLETHTYVKAIDICQYVKDTFGVEYGLSGITKWLTAHSFSYKYLKGVPAKADPEKQAKFIAYYEALKKNTPVNEPIEFADGVIPQWPQRLQRDGFVQVLIKPLKQQPLEHVSTFLVRSICPIWN